MPHYDIRLRIVCGETTCAVKAGDFCEYFEDYSSRPGGHCQLFGRVRENEAGWALRHPACLASSTPAEKPKGSA